MKLGGLHHITMITGDAQRNVDFTPTCSACGWSVGAGAAILGTSGF